MIDIASTKPATKLAIISIVAAAFALGNAYSPAEARVKVRKKTKHYQVRGKTGVEVFRSLVKHGPKASGLQHAIASTKPDFTFTNIQGVVRGRSCRVTNVDVNVSLTYTLPKWRDYVRASPDLRKRWDKFYKQLVRHENRHGQIVIDAAKKFERGMKRARGRVSRECEDLKTSVDRQMAPLVKQYTYRQMQFDKLENRWFSRISRAQAMLIRAK